MFKPHKFGAKPVTIPHKNLRLQTMVDSKCAARVFWNTSELHKKYNNKSLCYQINSDK